MLKLNILRSFLFGVFFIVGTAALATAVLHEDLLQYYRNRQLLKDAQKTLVSLENLNEDYDVLLEQVEKDPNVLRRIASVSLGAEQQDQDRTVYPRVTPEQLDAMRSALLEDPNQLARGGELPKWLVRSSEPYYRIALFTAGGFLMLISIICFGTIKPKGQSPESVTGNVTD
jgi:hypothetical protein